MLVDTAAVPGGGSAVVLVPAQDPAPPPGQGPEFGNASPVGLVVVLLLLIATVVLIRSMTKRIRRLPESFDPPDPDTEDTSGDADGADTASDRADGPTDGSPNRPGAGHN